VRLDHLLSRESGSPPKRTYPRSILSSRVKHERKGSHYEELMENAANCSRLCVVLPLSSCQGLLTRYFYNCIAEIENNYFNFAEGRRGKSSERERSRNEREERETSEREDAVDA
jgi:hypothetical protein